MTTRSVHGLGTLRNHGRAGRPAQRARGSHLPDNHLRFPTDYGAPSSAARKIAHLYRYDNPNFRQVTAKLAALEALDLLRAAPGRSLEETAAARIFSSGMAAITTAVLARVQAGQTIIAQDSLYGATFNFLNDVAPRLGIQA
jgi:cystathionine beta-lyase/cystathionine gamma-synthase